MDERVEKWLYDVKFAIEEIESYFENNEKAQYIPAQWQRLG